MKRIPHVVAVMTPFPHAVSAEDTVATAAAMMEQHGIHHLPVLKDGALAGILSQRDVFLATDVLDDSPDRLDKPVWAICTRGVYTVEVDERVDLVADHMANEHIGSAIVTRKGKLAGIVTTSDLCRAYAALLREWFAPVPDDDIA
jgi:CBS domain-containing protein